MGEQSPTVFKTKQMADATTAPLKKEKKNEDLVLSQTFEVGKKYMFELAEQNPERELPVIEVQGQKSRISPHKKFKPFQNIVFTSQIVWEGKRRMLRYYDGCDTIFADLQPKEKDVIDQFIKQTTRRNFIDGKFGCFGEEYWLLMYMNICSWNTDSPFRTRTASSIFKSVNGERIATVESSKLDQTEKALQLAKEATEVKMRIHADYLGISTIDFDSNNELTEKEIRTAYRKEALRNSDYFIESYGNKSIEVKYYIDQALQKGLINNKFNANKATWGSSNTEICDISGLKSPEAIAQRLFEFSQSEDGQEFLIQLKAISE